MKVKIVPGFIDPRGNRVRLTRNQVNQLIAEQRQNQEVSILDEIQSD